jgi:hypothetical protein
MIRTIKLKLLAAVLLISSNALAQGSYSIKNTVDFLDYLGWRESVDDNNRANYIGSPYLNESFTDGDLYYNREYLFRKIPLRYNIYNDVLEFLNKNKGVAYDINPTIKIDTAIIGGDIFVVDSLQLGKKVKSGYFELLNPGKVTLLLKMKVTLIPAQPAKLYNEATPPKFARNVDTYYARIGKSLPRRVKNINGLVSLINDKKKALSDYAKKEKLSNKPEDLVKLAEYYESL